MFENFPTTEAEKGKPAQEVFRADFETSENKTIKEGTDFLENMEPEKFKKKSANWLLAFSLLAGATSAFASEQNTDRDNLPSMGEEQISQSAESSAKKNIIAGFDWQKITNKIEVSIGTKREKFNGVHAEEIMPFMYGVPSFGVIVTESEFYKGVTETDAYRAYNSAGSSIYYSASNDDFISNLTRSVAGFSDMQKAIALQRIGLHISETYNYDMLDTGEHVKVSDDAMFQALKSQYSNYYNTTKSGICGNIHTYLTKTAESMGLEAWLQSGATVEGGHIWTGLVLGSGEERQITFLDGGVLIPTGTLNYKDALGVAERYHHAVTVLDSFVGNTNEVLLPVESRAQDVVKKAIGIEPSTARLGRNLLEGEIYKEETGLEISVSPETKEIKLTSDHIGLEFTNFQNSTNNPYQSLKDLNALGGSTRASNENFGVEAGATYLQMNTSDLHGGSVTTNEVVVTLEADYVDKKQLSKNEYGEFLLNFGTTLEAAIKLPPGIKNLKEGITEGAFGGRMIYLDPNNIGKFYIDASDVFRGQVNNFEEQKLAVREASRNFSVGSEVKVFEGSVLNMELRKSKLDWGESSGAKAGLTGGEFQGEIGYEKKSSDYERFIPSSEKIEIGFGYKGGPKWEVNIIGAKTTEKYKDAQSNDVYNAEVKLKMHLW